MDAQPTSATLARALSLCCAASAGVHAALVPPHWSESAVTGVLFAASAVALVVIAVGLEHAHGRLLLAFTATLLAGLLFAYAATRLTVVWPLDHVEPVDAEGAVTKLFEVGGLVLALRLMQITRVAQGSPAQRKGVRT